MRLLSGSKWIESNGSMISIIPHTDLLCILSPKGSGLLVSTSATSLVRSASMSVEKECSLNVSNTSQNEGLLFELGHVCSQVQAQSVEGSIRPLSVAGKKSHHLVELFCG